MGVLTVEIAKHLHVDYHGAQASSGPSGIGYLDGQVTQHVSMADASNVSLSGDLLTFKPLFVAPPVGLEVEVIIQQSNELSNWFKVQKQGISATGSFQFPASPGTIPIGMAFVRVVFLMNQTQVPLNPGEGAILNCTLNTSL